MLSHAAYVLVCHIRKQKDFKRRKCTRGNVLGTNLCTALAVESVGNNVLKLGMAGMALTGILCTLNTTFLSK